MSSSEICKEQYLITLWLLVWSLSPKTPIMIEPSVYFSLGRFSEAIADLDVGNSSESQSHHAFSR